MGGQQRTGGTSAALGGGARHSAAWSGAVAATASAAHTFCSNFVDASLGLAAGRMGQPRPPCMRVRCDGLLAKRALSSASGAVCTSSVALSLRSQRLEMALALQARPAPSVAARRTAVRVQAQQAAPRAQVRGERVMGRSGRCRAGGERQCWRLQELNPAH